MMNRSYRLIYNRSLQVWQAVSELARSAGKGSAAVKKPALAVLLSLAAGTAMAADYIIGGGATVTVPIQYPSGWDVGGNLTVGINNGHGTLIIQNGGQVTNTFGYIGDGGTGKVTVSGSGSTWANSDQLIVGHFGTGTLTIENGGTVSSDSTWLPYAGSGTLNLNGSSGARGMLITGSLSKGNGATNFNWDGGILRASAGSTNFLPGFSAGDINILNVNGGAFFDTNGFGVDIATAGILLGTGGFTKMGSGTLNIAGSNTYGGNTTVEKGTLTFASYTQSATQTLGIGVRSATDYGKLNVTGIADFNDDANIRVDVATAPTLANNAILNDVIKAGTLTANGFTVTDNSALFNFEAIQKTNSVDLKVVANSQAGIRNAVNQYGYGSALGAAGILDAQLNGGGDMGTVVTALGQLSNNRDVARAVTQTLPVVSAIPAIQGALTSFQTVVQNQNSNGGTATGLSSGDELSNKQAWARGFGSRAQQDDRNGTSGFSADSWGMAFGADAQVSRDARLGVAYGYAKTSVDGNTDISGTAQRANIDSHVVAVYGSKDLGNDRTLSYQADLGVNNNESTRQIGFGGLNRTATADYRTYSAHAGARLAQAFALSATTTFTPSVRADYTWLKAQRYSETGADALNLNVAAQKSDAFVIGADAHLQHRYSPRAKINVNLGVGYDAINDSGNIVAAYAGAPGQSFVANGMDHSPWLVRGGISYVYTTNSGTDITVRYDAEGRNDYVNQTASVRANWAF